MGKPCIRPQRYEGEGGVVVYAKTHLVLVPVLFVPPCFLPQVREQITGRGERISSHQFSVQLVGFS